MSEISDSQNKVCKKHNVAPTPSPYDSVCGVENLVLNNQYPIHGLRHPLEGQTNGWYLWSGDYKTDEDFFKPVHVKHLVEQCPDVEKFLALPPGWRFLIDSDYVDVWFDGSLLKT
jgi:hypothetical protein